MYEGERQRKPIRVVALVVTMWIVGNVLQAAIEAGAASTALLTDDAAVWAGRLLGWGALAAVCFAYREQLDDWLRDR
ncbi:MAG: hypothetical protein IT306_28140 [Chloroflexi bacterium]|nr:hypothetical protein [Chloroflexota bacterium]